MADILIRGMEMPKDGRKHTALLQFLEDGKCRAIVEYSKSYDDRSVKVFEAVPLPEGHGSLISRSSLRDAIKTAIDDDMSCPIHIKATISQLLDCAPTIIPAEGGTDDEHI